MLSTSIHLTLPLSAPPRSSPSLTESRSSRTSTVRSLVSPLTVTSLTWPGSINLENREVWAASTTPWCQTSIKISPETLESSLKKLELLSVVCSLLIQKELSDKCPSMIFLLAVVLMRLSDLSRLSSLLR